MADALQEPRFWLPSEFFDDFLQDKENDVFSGSEFFFPTESPHGFESKYHKNCTSPPPHMALTSPQNEHAVRDLFFRAKLKLEGGDVSGITNHNNLLSSSYQIYPQSRIPRSPIFQNNTHGSSAMWFQEQKRHRMWSGRVGNPLFAHQNPNRAVGSRVGGYGAVSDAGVKKERAGTGVFLPRSYGPYNSHCSNCSLDSLKNPGYSTAFVNTRSLNNFHNLDEFGSLEQPMVNRGFVSDYDLLVARMNALMLQRRQCFVSPGSQSGFLSQERNY